MVKRVTNEELALMIKDGFEGVDERFEKVDERFEKVEERLENLELGQNRIERKLDVEVKAIDEHDKRIKALETKVLSA